MRLKEEKWSSLHKNVRWSIKFWSKSARDLAKIVDEGDYIK
jgi:hypothetical protein